MRPVHLHLARSIALLLAGLFLFLWLAAVVMASGGGLGGGTTEAERAAQRGRIILPQPDPVIAHAQSGPPWQIGPTPWLWFGVALACLLAALLLQARLRQSAIAGDPPSRGGDTVSGGTPDRAGDDP